MPNVRFYVLRYVRSAGTVTTLVLETAQTSKVACLKRFPIHHLPPYRYAVSHVMIWSLRIERANTKASEFAVRLHNTVIVIITLLLRRINRSSLES